MKVQDREVVKNLLQYLTSKNLTGSVEFREALKHFNVTTVYRWENQHSERPYVVMFLRLILSAVLSAIHSKRNIPLMFFVRLYVRQEMMSDAYFLQTCD
ncbi:hypothetical protein ACP3NQ_004612 [Escherichia coli]